MDWRFAERDDQAVAQALVNGQGIDAIYSLNDVGLLTGFFAFLQASGILSQWHSFEIKAIERASVPTLTLLLLYGVRLLCGIGSNNALPALLFSNLGVMSLIGVTAWQVAHGFTRRGEQRRSADSDYALMDPQTLAGAISKAGADELARLFNGTIHCLAAYGLFAAEVLVAIDGTPIVTTALYAGCGLQRKRVKRRTKAGVEIKSVELLYGWRLIVLVDLLTLIPLAVKVVPIQQHEAPFLLELVEQAQRNLAPYSRIRWLVADRAYVDGPRLYALNEMGIQFVVIAKTNMKIYATACRRSQRSLIQQRVESRSHGHGSQAWTEELVSRVQSVTNLRDWDTYRPPKQPGRRLSRGQRPTLNAVVVRQWRNQVAATGPRVYLTNMSVSDPWPVVDAYDDRSWIENGLFRHHKQFCHLTRWFPQKTEGGVRSHLLLVMLIFAVATAYRLWDKRQTLLSQPQPEPPAPSPVSYHTLDPTTGEVDDLPPRPASATHLASRLTGDTDAETEPPLAHSLLAGQGVARWQRDLTRQQRDQVIVFCGNRYGIFNLNELLVLLGVSVQHLPPQLGSSPTDILRRYDCWPNSP